MTGPDVSGESTEPGQAGTSKLEAAYQALKERIVEGVYGPGYRLVISRVAQDFGMSTVPVREAVRRLEAEGYVEFTRNVGPRVAHLDENEYAQIMGVLALLEGHATALATPYLRSRDLARAERLNQQLAEAQRLFDPAAFTEINREFHFVFYRRCPNAHLRSLIEAEWGRLDAVRRSTFAFVPGRAAESIAEHEKLLGLIRSRAATYEVEEIARRHKIGTVEALMVEFSLSPRRGASPPWPDRASSRASN